LIADLVEGLSEGVDHFVFLYIHCSDACSGLEGHVLDQNSLSFKILLWTNVLAQSHKIVVERNIFLIRYDMLLVFLSFLH